MSSTPDRESQPIDARLAEYRALLSQFEAMRDRVRRAEGERHTVPRRVYEKVRAEYDRELDALRARMTPLRDELDHAREAFEAELEEANEALEAIEEEMAELVFRHRIGEFPDDVMDTRRGEIETRVDAARARIASIRETLAAMEQGSSDPAGASPEQYADAPVPAPTRRPEPSPEREPEIQASPVAENAPPTETPPPAVGKRPVLGPLARTEPKRDSFENPHDWIDEIRIDSADPGEPSNRAEDDVPAEEPPAAAPAPPSLVFVSGPHAGQSIPLLQTTLTIGREHDNNIEIKDLDVARYHARILNLRGDYVVEDMASSTGTWVNGKRVEREVLGHGDVIRIGQTEIAVDFEWASNSLERAGIDPTA